MDQPDPTVLARRLRQLRRQRWPERQLTQESVAGALGVALSSVSSWESTTSTKTPPAFRLADYATFFATPRSVAGTQPRLLAEGELTEQEGLERDRLAAELEQLREAAVGETGPAAGRPSLWHFPDGGPVRLVCGKTTTPPPHVSARNHNYTQLAAYADLDALVELFGHVRAENPRSDVRFDLAPRLESDDLAAHLVLLGSGAINQATERAVNLFGFPVRQVSDPEIEDGEVFEVVDEPSHRYGPKFVGSDPQGAVTEDVGYFFRTPNPNNMARTLTICSGVFTRGTYGAVRFLTDARLRDTNQAMLIDLFGDAATFALLMRVRILDHATSTPDLRNPVSVLYSWSWKT